MVKFARSYGQLYNKKVKNWWIQMMPNLFNLIPYERFKISWPKNIRKKSFEFVLHPKWKANPCN